jgi:hypothetical protein
MRDIADASIPAGALDQGFTDSDPHRRRNRIRSCRSRKEGGTRQPSIQQGAWFAQCASGGPVP